MLLLAILILPSLAATDKWVNVSSTDGGKTLVIEDGTMKHRPSRLLLVTKVKDLGGYFIH